MLLAQFVGIVHEVTPNFLKRNKKYQLEDDHLHPALIALGSLTPNAREIVRSFRRRKYKITIAESFDIRLSAITRRQSLSPFIAIKEILAEPQDIDPPTDYSPYFTDVGDGDEQADPTAPRSTAWEVVDDDLAELAEPISP